MTSSKKKVTGVTVECAKLKTAALLFAFHETSKTEYLIKMAQSGASINPPSTEQRINGLRQTYNDRLDAVKEIYLAVSTSTNKTKKITPEMNNLLSQYYSENNNSKLPDGYSWPVSL